MVEHPSEYRWSSFRANAHGEANDQLDPHPVYLAMDQDDQLRQQAYRELFLCKMEAGLIDEIRDTLNHELVLGRSHFKDLIEQETGRQARPGKPGRPPSNDQSKIQH
jgi:putative transposase